MVDQEEDPGLGVVEVLEPGVVTQPPVGDNIELVVRGREGASRRGCGEEGLEHGAAHMPLL
jgi:hypothetical protein